MKDYLSTENKICWLSLTVALARDAILARKSGLALAREADKGVD